MPLGYHQLYCDGLDKKVRFPRHRYPRLVKEIERRTGNTLVRCFSPRLGTTEEICFVHDSAYVERFMSGQLTDREKRGIGLRPWTDSIIERTLRLVGGSVEALFACMETNTYAGNLAGGTHHAFVDRGTGYCIFNDIAITAVLAKQRGIERISILDLDVHQGDGTAVIFKDDETIQTISVHCQQNFPFQKQESDIDIPLQEYSSDHEYIDAVSLALEYVEQFSPELLLFQGGVDALIDDGLGRLSVSREGLQDRNRLVFDLVDRLDIPCLVFMGGGYSKPIEPTIMALADLYVEAAKRHQRRWITQGYSIW